jgi:hypothetical protein
MSVLQRWLTCGAVVIRTNLCLWIVDQGSVYFGSADGNVYTIH